MDTVYTVATIAAFVVSGAVVALNGIAPLTKNNVDNKLLSVLSFVHDKILVVILPFLAVRLTTAETAGEPESEDEVK